jgi:hypothetical protein
METPTVVEVDQGQLTIDDAEWDLGPACSIVDETCESCQ